MSGFYDENNFNSNIPTPPQAPPMPGVNRPQPQPQPEPESETQVYQPPQAPRINPQPARPAYENPQNPNTAYAYYNPPQAPRAPMPPQQGYAPYYPPQAPTYQRPPVPPVPPVQPVQPPVQQPVQPPIPPVQNYYGTSYSQPRPQPMSNGLKALIITLVVLLCGSLFVFIGYISMNAGSKNETKSSSPFGENFYPTIPSDYYGDEEEETTPSKEYKQSDYSDKTDKDYKGMKLEKKPSSGKSGSSYAFSKIENSIVGVICYVDGQEGTAESYSGMGTGIILTEDGYIVTNSHIVNHSRTAYLYKVITSDKKEYEAGVVGFDSRSDIAVLKIDAKGLKPATFGDSSELEIADDVIVVGNPLSLDYQNSVTKGIVSALNRRVGLKNNVKYIQTDAAINPGNSGGPLCNMYGQVVGVTNSKIALEDYEGMGFAIPSQTVKKSVDDIIRYGYVKGRVKIGITGEVDTYGDNGELGIKIITIDEDSEIGSAGAEKGDFITKVDDKKIGGFGDIFEILEGFKEGDKVKITLYRPSTDKTYDVNISAMRS